MPDKQDPALTKAGTVVVRAGAAAAAPLLMSVVGAEGAAAISEVMAQGGEQVVTWLDGRRTGRVQRTLERAHEQIGLHREAGEMIRPDLVDPENGDAAALFEAVVGAAADSAEDRKCAVVANLYGSLAFDSDATIDDALLFVRRVREASWRQIACLAYLNSSDRQEERELATAKAKEGDAQVRPLMRAEMDEMAETLGLIGFGQPGGGVAPPGKNWGDVCRCRSNNHPPGPVEISPT